MSLQNVFMLHRRLTLFQHFKYLMKCVNLPQGEHICFVRNNFHQYFTNLRFFYTNLCIYFARTLLTYCEDKTQTFRLIFHNFFKNILKIFYLISRNNLYLKIIKENNKKLII